MYVLIHPGDNYPKLFKVTQYMYKVTNYTITA